jgi:hypothetical protein
MNLRPQEDIDYRTRTHREDAFLLMYAAMLETGELHQQFRLMLRAIRDDESYTKYPKAKRIEKELWLAFLWGACYNGVGPWTIISKFPLPPTGRVMMNRFKEWYNLNFSRMRFDTDCRYRKSKMINCVESYVSKIKMHGTQYKMMLNTARGDEGDLFSNLWGLSLSVRYFGRLAAWNHLEAAAIVLCDYAIHFDANDLMLEDITGSESNRNGVAWVVGREDLCTKKGIKANGSPITEIEVELLVSKSNSLWFKAQDRLFTVNSKKTLFNFETALCWFKKMISRTSHSRYLGWDGDRTWNELKYLEEAWTEIDIQPLWQARQIEVPGTLLCENYPEQMERGESHIRMKSFHDHGMMPEVMAYRDGVVCVLEDWVSTDGKCSACGCSPCDCDWGN